MRYVNQKSIIGLSYLFSVLLFFVMQGCELIEEENLGNDRITLLAPADTMETDIVTQTFWWEKLEGAARYRLQVVYPSFAQVESLIADTLVSGNQFALALYPGDFEWRMRAENSTSNTDWQYRSFQIYYTDDLSRQTINLKQPAENGYTNREEILFKWDTLSIADSYLFQLYENEWQGTLVDDSLVEKKGDIRFPLEEGVYYWGIKAINEVSQSLFYKRQFTVDRTSPALPVLKSPSDNSVENDTMVVFEWTSRDINSSFVEDSLMVYSDEALSSLVHFDVTDKKKSTIDLDYDKTYYWRVRSFDKAGNVSPYSDALKFSVNRK